MRPSHRRRSARSPGRRLPLAATASLAALATAAPAAVADQPVVSATIYPGAQGSLASRQATLSQLQACPLYTGANPLYLYPGQQPYQAPGDSTWTVAEVLQCGLGVPAAQISDVQVQTTNRGYEAPLTSAALSDPGQYQDPSAPGALPIISSDGAEDQNTYVRPYRGGADDNAGDQVVQTGAPIALLVYLNGSLLSVTATQHTVSHTSNTRTVTLAASVRDSAGAPLPASALTWSWSFGDGRGSSAAAPTHTFTAGVYSVSVQATDAATGSGGTATLRVAFAATGSSGTRNQSGGPKPTKSKNPTGSGHGSHKPTTGSGAHDGQPTTTTSHNQHPAASTSPTTTASTTATTTASTSTAPTTPARPRPPAHRHAASPARAPRTPVVSGRLISDVTALPAGSSPLVHLTPAAATPEASVRQASHLSAAPAVGGALAVGLLLVLGAGRELRGRRRWLDGGG